MTSGFHLTGEQRTSHTASSTVRNPCGRLEWHVVATVPTRQFHAENALSCAGWRVYHPLHLERAPRQRHRIISLFPGYLFVGWRAGVDWSSLCRSQYVWRILMTEPGQPAIVPAEVIAELQARTSPRRIVDDPLWAAPRWSRGQRVTVVEGPLAGLQGVCGKNAGERINVLFDLFSRPMMADFAPHDLVEAPG